MMFAIFLLLCVVLSGAVCLLDALVLRHRRPANAQLPTVVEYAKSFFPVLLLVFVVRSFLVEPFKIPSGSMMPTLLAGDYILVNKFQYGIRLPIGNHTLIPISTPARGDVIVFHYPPKPSIDYIKRVVGLPGDQIAYQNKRLTINGVPVAMDKSGRYDYMLSADTPMFATQYAETLGRVTHSVLLHSVDNRYQPRSLGELLASGETITVPAEHYFVMGDNRDNSADSRVWGFVPEENLVGPAFFIWMNFNDFSRIGDGVH